MKDDVELLRLYVAEKSEAAFTELVRRHLGFVYQTALRQLHGDAHAAEDVCQQVFTDLARKAAGIMDRPLLGWLHTSARYAALHRIRTEMRRAARDEEAHRMAEMNEEAPVDWSRTGRVIDEALGALSEDDRAAVLMRFFQGLSFAEVAERLQLSPDNARQRVQRAVARMERHLHRQGIRSTAAALSTALAAIPAAGAPAGLVESVAGSALNAAAVSANAAVSGALGLLGGKAAWLLGGSLAANAVVGLFAYQAVVSDRAAVESAVSVAPVMALVRPTPAPSVRLLTDPVEIGRKLRADGYSDRAVAAGIRFAVLALYPSSTGASGGAAAREARLRPWNSNPQSSVAIAASLKAPEPARPDPRIAQHTAEAMAAFGFDPAGVPFATRYRGIPAEKAVLLDRIERDHQAVGRQAGVSAAGSTFTSVAEGALLSAEFERDIRAALTPEEVAAYFRYSTPEGEEARQNLVGLQVAPAAFDAIVEAHLDAARRRPSSAPRPDLLRVYRRELGDRDFMRIIGRLPSARFYARIDALYERAGLDVTQRADLLFRVQDGVAAIHAAAPDAKPALASSLYGAFTVGVGLSAEQVVAFDASEFAYYLREAGAVAPVR